MRKVLTGPGAGEPPATTDTYVVHVTCRTGSAADAVTVLDRDVRLVGAASVTLPDVLPIGARCWGVETSSGTATSSSVYFDSDANSAVVTQDSPTITLTATNTFVVIPPTTTPTTTPPTTIPPTTTPPGPTEPGLPITGASLMATLLTGILLISAGLALITVRFRRSTPHQ